MSVNRPDIEMTVVTGSLSEFAYAEVVPLQRATSPAAVPAQPGTYVLVLRLSRATTLRVGRLGEFDFPCGLYLYVDSAQGTGGLRARLTRHWRAHKPLHWHVDYLREVAVPVGVLIFSAFMSRIRDELSQAARIDGANDFTILSRVVLPLSLPALAVVILFYAVGHWNAYFNALVYIRSRDLYPLQLVLREILITSNVESMTTSVSTGDAFQVGQTIKYATIVVATLPILVIYPFLQKYFVKGALIGAIKE